MAVSIVQRSPYTSAFGANPTVFPAPCTAGNTIIALVWIDNYLADPSAMTDDLGNTYVQDGSGACTAAGSIDHFCCYRKSNLANAPQTVTVTVTSRNSKIVCYEVSGLDNTSPKDLFQIGNGPSSASPSFAYTTAAAGEFVAGILSTHAAGSGKTLTAGSGWTLDSPAFEIVWYQSRAPLAGTSGNFDASLSGADGVSDCLIVSYKAPASGSTNRGWAKHLLRAAISAALFYVVPNSPSQVDFPGGAGGGIVTWTAPLTNADGSDVANPGITGYTVYWGTTEGEQGPSGAFTGSAAVAAGTLTKTLSGLAANTWFVAVTATNAAGESAPSPETSGAVA